MTVPLLLRRRSATRPQRHILSVSDYWRVDSDRGPLRRVIIRDYDGQLRRAYMPDEHPALVSFLERAAAVAA